MNALVTIDPAARARAIRAKFFPATKPVNWIKNPPKPEPSKPVFEISPPCDAHVTAWQEMKIRAAIDARKSRFTRELEAVAKRHGLKVPDLKGPCRRREYVLARQEAMWIGHVRLGMSYPDIGRRLGGKDHTTVLHGVKKHAKRHGLPMRPGVV
jgi:hypothetical protein